MNLRFPRTVTNDEKYRPAMSVETESEAREYLEACIQHTMSLGLRRAEAERIERQNIAFAAYYGFRESDETIARLGKLFHIEKEFTRLQQLK